MKRNLRDTGTLVLIAAALFTACSTQPEASNQVEPMPTIPEQPKPSVEAAPTVTLGDGFSVKLELAVTPEEQMLGLMYRPKLPEDTGMLFIHDDYGYPPMWMKNTLIPLDLVFLDETGTIVDIAADTPPCVADPCPLYRPSKPALAVLELLGGTCENHGVVIGDRIEFANVSGYPRAELAGADASSG
jgi:uncharacterized membrane protein (UPF0127 family)